MATRVTVRPVACCMSTAQCKFECQNGGRCVSLNKCKCRPGFTGHSVSDPSVYPCCYSSLALSVRSVSIPLLLVTLHWHSVSDPSVYPCWLLFTGTQCQIRQYTLVVGYSSTSALSVRSVSIPLLLVTLHWHSVSDPSVYPCCWLLFTGTQCQIRQYTLVVGYSSLALSVRSSQYTLVVGYSSLALSVRSVSIHLLVTLHWHSVSDPSVYSCCYSSLALSVRSVSIPLLLVTLHWHSVSDPSVYPCCWLLFTGTQCQIRQYTLVVGYSSLALSVRSVSIPLLLVTLHWHSVLGPSVYACCWLLFTGTQRQIRQYTLAVGYSSLALSVRSLSIHLLVTLHWPSVSDPSVYPCWLLFTGPQCQIPQYTLVGYSSLALSVRSVSMPLLVTHSATLLTVGLQSHHMHPSSTLCFRSHLCSWCFFSHSEL